MCSAGVGDEEHRPDNHPWLRMCKAPDSFTAEERVLTFLSANVGAGRLADVARDWRHLPPSAHERGMEVVLQTHLFAGFARTINGLATIDQVGVACETTKWQEEIGDAQEWRKQGEESCAAIYGNVYDKLRRRMAKMHPVLDRIMVDHGYGRIISRGGLSLRLRELSVVAVLAGMDVAPQLNSHLRGAKLVGAAEEEIRAVVAATHLAWGDAAQAQADATLETVRSARYGL